MTAVKIATPKEFFDHVVLPDIKDFNSDRVSLRFAYHACTSLLSLRDWVKHTHENRPWTANGQSQPVFTKVKDLQDTLNILDHRCAIVTDIANASKHMVLDPKRSQTKLWGNANTEVATTSSGGFGRGAFGRAPFGHGDVQAIVVEIDKQDYDVHDCVTAVSRLWGCLFTENNW